MRHKLPFTEYIFAAIFLVAVVCFWYFAYHPVYDTVQLPPTGDLCGAVGCPTTAQVRDFGAQSNIVIISGIVMLLSGVALRIRAVQGRTVVKKRTR